MPSIHIALLRAVNVGGNKPIAMAELRNLLAELGFEQVRSLLQTGNLVFKSKEQTGVDLEGLLKKKAAQRLDLHTDLEHCFKTRGCVSETCGKYLQMGHLLR